MITTLEIYVFVLKIIQFDDHLVATVDKLCLELWQTKRVIFITRTGVSKGQERVKWLAKTAQSENDNYLRECLARPRPPREVKVWSLDVLGERLRSFNAPHRSSWKETDFCECSRNPL